MDIKPRHVTVETKRRTDESRPNVQLRPNVGVRPNIGVRSNVELRPNVGVRSNVGVSPNVEVRPNVELHIDELVLHGFSHGDRYRIGEALERELARLLDAEGMPPRLLAGGDAQELDAGSFQIAPRAKPEDVGAQIARAIYGGFRKL